MRRHSAYLHSWYLYPGISDVSPLPFFFPLQVLFPAFWRYFFPLVLEVTAKKSAPISLSLWSKCDETVRCTGGVSHRQQFQKWRFSWAKWYRLLNFGTDLFVLDTVTVRAAPTRKNEKETEKRLQKNVLKGCRSNHGCELDCTFFKWFGISSVYFFEEKAQADVPQLKKKETQGARNGSFKRKQFLFTKMAL